MSRGAGRIQEYVVKALGRKPLLVLRGETRSLSVSLLRAARALEKAGRCVVVRLWAPGRRCPVTCAARPDYEVDGQKVSVASEPGVSLATLTDSTRDLARRERVSQTTICRDLRKAAGVKESRLDAAKRACRRLDADEREQLREWLDG